MVSKELDGELSSVVIAVKIQVRTQSLVSLVVLRDLLLLLNHLLASHLIRLI